MDDKLKASIDELRGLDVPDKYPSYHEVMEKNRIEDKYEFTVVYRTLSEEQKCNAVKRFFLGRQKSGCGLRNIMKELEGV